MGTLRTLQIGRKIKALRLSKDLTQTELADRANLTKGFISQLENEQTSISVDSLADILDALGVSLAEFFSEQRESRVVYAPGDRVPIEGKGAKSFELLVPGSTNNLMDPVMVELAPGEHLEAGDPHPGEQFGYVLKGSVTLSLANKKYRVPGRHCFAFTADKPHLIANQGRTPAQFLWIVAPPQM